MISEALIRHELIVSCNTEKSEGDRYMANLIATIAGNHFRCGITYTLADLNERLTVNRDNLGLRGVVIFSTDIDDFVSEAVGAVRRQIDRPLPVGVITTDDHDIVSELSTTVSTLYLRRQLGIVRPVRPIEEFITQLVTPQSN